MVRLPDCEVDVHLLVSLVEELLGSFGTCFNVDSSPPFGVEGESGGEVNWIVGSNVKIVPILDVVEIFKVDVCLTGLVVDKNFFGCLAAKYKDEDEA